MPTFLGSNNPRRMLVGQIDSKDEGTMLLQNVGIYQSMQHKIPEGL
jgi:hypothetical protein